MTDSEWIANIHNFSNAEIFERLEWCGCDGYYRDIWSACIEELQRRVNLTSCDLISREALKENGTVIAIVNGEKMKVVPVKYIDNAPTVTDRSRELVQKSIELGHNVGYFEGKTENKRPQGEWKEAGYETGALGITYRQTQCSNCGWEHALPMRWNFCPNCGADMKRR